MVAADEDDSRPVEGLAVHRRSGRWQALGVDRLAAAVAVGGDLGRQIGLQRLGQQNRAVHVQQSCALLQQVGVRQRLRGVLEDGLDQRRRQAGIGLQHQRGGTRHGRRSDRGAAHQHLRFGQRGRDAQRRDQGAGISVGKVVPRQRVAGRGRRTNHSVARCHQVGFEQVVDTANTAGVDQRSPRRAASAEKVHAVVTACRRAFEVGGTHRDHRRVVARRADPTVGFLAQQVHAEIACRHHHRDAGGACAAHRNAQRVGLPALGRVGGQAQVEHANVVFLGVVDDPLDAFERVAQRAHAKVVEHPHVVDIGVGRDAVDVLRRGGCGSVVAPCRHRGDMGAVAVGVLRRH